MLPEDGCVVYEEAECFFFALSNATKFIDKFTKKIHKKESILSRKSLVTAD